MDMPACSKVLQSRIHWSGFFEIHLYISCKKLQCLVREGLDEPLQLSRRRTDRVAIQVFLSSDYLCLNEFSCVKDKPNVWRTLIIEMYRSLPVWGLQTPFDNEVVRFDAPLDITQIKPRDNEWKKYCTALGVLYCSGVVVFPIIFTNLKLYRFSVCPSLDGFGPFVWFSFSRHLSELR